MVWHIPEATVELGAVGSIPEAAKTLRHLNGVCVYIYIYIYIYICVYIYIYICVCVCAHACVPRACVYAGSCRCPTPK